MFRWTVLLLAPFACIAAQFSIRTDNVLLNASVQSPTGGYVTGLKKANFRVLDDGRAVTIQHFAASDTPVTVGLIVDNSGSMRQKKVEVVMAGLWFARTSNPSDEFFVVNFNSHVYSALPRGVAFTDKLQLLRSALYLGNPIGETALYDAVLAGLDHLKEGHRDIRVLIVVSDGGDNASHISFSQLTKEIEASHATIYTIGLLDPLDRDLNPRVLRKMSQLSGGEFFEPETQGDIKGVFTKISHDIRNRYVLGFVPNYAHDPRTLHKLRVEARDDSGRKLLVHARTAFLSSHE